MKNEQKKIRSQEATPQPEPKDAPPWTRARVFSDDSDGSCIVMRSETDGDRVVATGTVYKAIDTLADLLRDKDVHELPSPEAAAFLDAHGYNRDGTPKTVAAPSPETRESPIAVPDTTLDAAMAAEMSQVDRYEEAAGEKNGGAK